ncbi:MAG: type II secretion system protein GspJ [Spirochaetia bacterium]|nr:type II secretion system protein GspJ [Spirochaetia bacterium]
MNKISFIKAGIKNRRYKLLKGKARKGLTLLELSLVLLVFSTLVTILMGMFYITTRTTKETVPLTREKSKAMIALEMMRVALNNTYYQPDLERLVFVSRSDPDYDRITFATYDSSSEKIGASAVREVSFYVKQTGSGNVLMRRDDETVDENPGEGGNHHELLGNVEKLKFRFTLDGQNWEDKWNTKQTKAVPRLITITLAITNPKGKTEVLETIAGPGIYLD